jgi:hypothetical protein
MKVTGHYSGDSNEVSKVNRNGGDNSGKLFVGAFPGTI